jgi:endonuclease/exonuclease/phosphatase family metal-dependent hydrolase
MQAKLKIVTLNTWGGIQDKVMFDWIKNQMLDTQIFCFQEIYSSINPAINLGQSLEHHNLKQELKNLLSDFVCYYREHIYNTNFSGLVDFDLSYGLAIFVHKSIDSQVVDEGDILIYGSKKIGMSRDEPTSRNLQYLTLKINNRFLNVINFHGIWIKEVGKRDHPARLEQNKNIIKFIEKLKGEVFLTGDFNSLPENESLKMISSELCLRNLITENNVLSTRSKLYTKPDKYADYTFVSEKLEILTFEVPSVEASDHLPMITKIIL